MLNVNLESLKKVARDFYSVTKIKIVVYNEKRIFLYSYPEQMCLFCKEIRKHKTLAKKCFDSDKYGFDVCDKTKDKYIYTCHMGLVEAIFPILENNIIIGYMMLGQVRNHVSEEKIIENIKYVATTYQVNADVLMSEMNNMEIADQNTIISAANIMEMCACYLWFKQIIRVNSYSLAYHLGKYIDENLSGDLSVKTLCQHLNISKSSLYKLSLSCFNMGISDYIRLRRIQMAEKLIYHYPQLPISEVAMKCGIADANYLTKVFKKYTGLAPKKYRERIY